MRWWPPDSTSVMVPTPRKNFKAEKKVQQSPRTLVSLSSVENRTVEYDKFWFPTITQNDIVRTYVGVSLNEGVLSISGKL